MRGFFEIGIYKPKTANNIGTLWRSAYQLGAAGIFVIGKRYKKQCSDTVCAYKHIPLKQYDSFETFLNTKTYDCQLIGIEQGGNNLKEFEHPKRCIYLLGAEDNMLPIDVLDKCHDIISIESIRTNSYNVSVTGSIVMYDRVFG